MGDLRTTEGQSLPLTDGEKSRRRLRLITLFLGGVLALAAAGHFIKVDRYLPATGYVTTEAFAEVRPAVVGKVAAILVGTNKPVAEGDVLVRLENAEEASSLAEAQSLVRKVEAELARREAEIAEAKRQHQWQLAEAEYVLADVRHAIDRLDRALAGDAAAGSDMSLELASLEAARDEVAKAKAQLVRREAEISEARRRHKWAVAEAELVLQNACSASARIAQMVKAKLTAGAALEEAKLKEELARVAVLSLKDTDDSIHDKELAELRAGVKAREKAVQRAEARLRGQLDKMKLKEKLSELHLTSLREQDVTIYDKELAVKRQELLASRETVSRAETRLRGREVCAPIAGQALRYEFVIGELVRPEIVLYDIFGGDQRVLKLRVGERYATRVAPGQRYVAKLASYSGSQSVEFTGQVEALRHAIQSDAQQTYRLAYCSFDPREHAVPPGTSAEARIYYGRSSLWMALFGLD